MALLEVNNLRVWFHTRAGITRAVDGVDLDISRGETLGVVGESGCGKSVTFYSMLGLLPVPPAKIESGAAVFDGADLLHSDASTLRRLRGHRIAMIFQDPMTALNPYMKIGKQVMEPLLVHRVCDRGSARRRAAAMLEAVGLRDVEQCMNMYPHAFSGGMRQRVVIAMALAPGPDLLIADEPTTALDVTVQAQILDLIAKLKAERDMAVALITHDLGIVAGLCDRVVVMYAGRIVEKAETGALFKQPMHPYTRALMDSLPTAHSAGGALRVIPGLPPEMGAPELGCPFAPRCIVAVAECHVARCPLRRCGDNAHFTACIRALRGEWP